MLPNARIEHHDPRLVAAGAAPWLSPGQHNWTAALVGGNDPVLVQAGLAVTDGERVAADLLGHREQVVQSDGLPYPAVLRSPDGPQHRERIRHPARPVDDESHGPARELAPTS